MNRFYRETLGLELLALFKAPHTNNNNYKDNFNYKVFESFFCVCSHYNYKDKKIQTTIITMFLIPSQSHFYDARTTIKCFQPIQIKFRGEVMTSLAEELITEVQKKPGTFWQKPFLLQKCRRACMLFAFLDSQ